MELFLFSDLLHYRLQLLGSCYDGLSLSLSLSVSLSLSLSGYKGYNNVKIGVTN